MATSFVGENAVSVFRAITLKSGLKMYKDIGMQPNRAWTPSAMMRTAAHITGKKFKARDYAGAIKALEEWIEAAPKDGIS